MSNFHDALARVARAGPRLELGTVQICVLVAMRLVTQDEVLAELDEERLSDLYVSVVEVVEGGSRLPRKKATHGLELLRQQGLLSRVDGAGLVRAGAYSLTRLGAAIANSWLEDESLTRQSLVLLTTALRSNLSQLLNDANTAQDEDDWEDIRQRLRVTVASLVEGIDRRRQGLDAQQTKIQDEVSDLLAASWHGAIESCEQLLDETTETLGELKDVLMGEAGDLLNLLADIESLAADSDADRAADAAREAQLKVDGIAVWGRERHEAWSEYFRMVQRFIREHVRMDPDRAVSQRLQSAISNYPEQPWAVPVADQIPYLHLRQPDVEKPRVGVRRQARDRETEPELVDPNDWQADLALTVSKWLEEHPATTLSEALKALLPKHSRFRVAGHITRHLALLGYVDSDRERPWAPVDGEFEVEQWRINRREG